MIGRRRAVLAVAAPVLVPPSVVGLARIGRWDSALAVSLLFAVYVALEVTSWLRREAARRATQRAVLRSRGRVLADVTESREGWWVA